TFDPYRGRKVRGEGGRTRGVVHWGDGPDQRIFVAVQQFLYALDATTGHPIPSFGKGGRIDMRDGLRPGEKLMVSLGTPGIVYRNLLIIGSRTAESLPTPPGDVRAYDVRTGALRWTFHTIPRPGEFGYETWPKDAWTYSGAANNWAGMSLDVDRGLVFVPTGSAADDYYGANRRGDDLFANSLIALKAETGARVWHFQFVRHDIWDRDLPAPPNLVTVRRDSRSVDGGPGRARARGGSGRRQGAVRDAVRRLPRRRPEGIASHRSVACRSRRPPDDAGDPGRDVGRERQDAGIRAARLGSVVGNPELHPLRRDLAPASPLSRRERGPGSEVPDGPEVPRGVREIPGPGWIPGSS